MRASPSARRGSTPTLRQASSKRSQNSRMAATIRSGSIFSHDWLNPTASQKSSTTWRVEGSTKPWRA